MTPARAEVVFLSHPPRVGVGFTEVAANGHWERLFLPQQQCRCLQMAKDMCQMAIASVHQLEAHQGNDREQNPHKHQNMLEDVRVGGGTVRANVRLVGRD